MSDQRPALGVDLGGTKIHSLVTTPDGQVLGEDRCLTEAAQGPDAVIERLVASLRRALEAAGLGVEAVVGVGVSSPGPCDPARGIVGDAPNLLGWHEVPIVRIVSEALGVPAVLENDGAAACYGEYRFGVGRGHRHIVYVTLGTGIGGGILIDGRIYQGASGAAGEVGHLILVEDGPRCNCGARGCLEALASGTAIAREAAAVVESGRSPLLAKLAAGGRATPELAHKAALQGDAASREVIARAGRYLGLGLVGILSSFNPQALILGGGLIGLGDFYLEPALRTARDTAFAQILEDVTICTAELGERSGALGAAALVMEHEQR